MSQGGSAMMTANLPSTPRSMRRTSQHTHWQGNPAVGPAMAGMVSPAPARGTTAPRSRRQRPSARKAAAGWPGRLGQQQQKRQQQRPRARAGGRPGRGHSERAGTSRGGGTWTGTDSRPAPPAAAAAAGKRLPREKHAGAMEMGRRGLDLGVLRDELHEMEAAAAARGGGARLAAARGGAVCAVPAHLTVVARRLEAAG